MDRDASGPKENRRQPLLRQADQITVAVMAFLCLAAILVHWIWHLAIGNSLISIEQAPPLELQFEVRVNQADWPELTLLPNIGEVLAQRIVDYRQQHGVFQSLDELKNVKGIGPKTLRRIRPYVRLE